MKESLICLSVARESVPFQNFPIKINPISTMLLSKIVIFQITLLLLTAIKYSTPEESKEKIDLPRPGYSNFPWTDFELNATTTTTTTPKADTIGSGNGTNANQTKLTYLGQRCGPLRIKGDPKETNCDSKFNLICEDPIPNEFSKCECIPDTDPHPAGLPICVYPPKILEIGSPCNPNSTDDDEKCEGELSICENGICECAKDNDQILFDAEHKDCYLKINPRHGAPDEGETDGAMRTFESKFGWIFTISLAITVLLRKNLAF